MMTTRRSLFVFGALLAVGVLLAPQAAFAQLAAGDTPQTVTATAKSATEIEVAWTAPAANAGFVQSYEIEWATAAQTLSADLATLPAGRSMAGISATAVKYTITGLEPSTVYSVQVRARQNAQVTNWEGAAETAETPAEPTPLAAPTGLDASPGDEMVTLSWNAVAGATGYKVQWRTASQDYGVAMQTDTVTAPSTGMTVSHTVDDLENGMEYMFQVMAMDAGGDGMPSREVKQTPMAAAAEAGAQPTNVKLTPKGRDMITVSWDYSGEGTDTAIRFDVGWTEADGTMFTESLAPQTIVPVPGRREARSYTLEDLSINDEYLIAVRAVHGDGAGGQITPHYSHWRYRGDARERTPADVYQVQNVNVAAGDGELMVTWDPVSSVGTCTGAASPAVNHCGYMVDWRAANQSFDNPDRQMRVTDLSYTITGLTNGTEYGVIVRSYNEREGKGTLSDESREARQTPMMPTPALPVFGVLALGAGLVAAGRRRLRAQRQLKA